MMMMVLGASGRVRCVVVAIDGGGGDVDVMTVMACVV